MELSRIAFRAGRGLPRLGRRPRAPRPAAEGARWLFSFLSADRRRSYCLYEAATADAIRAAARRAGLPADAVVVEGPPRQASVRGPGFRGQGWEIWRGSRCGLTSRMTNLASGAPR
ncbi:MAG: DUF4242 domain-containing protein [Candidatus Dormibacteraeota bacterium]|nr:DUF4242 domain-containing protein [Candidatus Dormibacteraeota bacterium]